MADLFAGDQQEIPSNWTFKVSLPVLTGSLGALAAAAGRDELDRWLVSATAIGILFTIVASTVLRSDRHYFELKLGISAGRRRLKLAGWRALRWTGELVIAYSCIATLISTTADHS